jgi:hypothetical protein
MVAALLALVLLAFVKPVHNGDAVEYALTATAIARHGTADIRLDDIAAVKPLLPEHLRIPMNMLEDGMRKNDQQLYAAFTRGREGRVYAIHFWGYPLLAALPYKVLDAVSADPLKCFQVVNCIALIVLAAALGRLFRSTPKALAALALFMLCGGYLYWSWSSPEFVSAALLLAGLALFSSGAPVAGGLLAGLASQQNPTIVVFFGFAPLLVLATQWRAGDGAWTNAWADLRINLKRAWTPRLIAGAAAGVAMFSLPILFNLYQWGVPNIIARLFSDPSLIGAVRLVSFYFDLNQGMVIGIPGVLLALTLWGWQGQTYGAIRAAVVLALLLAMTLALALPALAVLNWNSGAAGVMRYGFWAAMPIMFALLWRMRQHARWPVVALAAAFALQLASTWSAQRYSYVEFSPLARFVMQKAPHLYHPEPEIFSERLGHHDDYIRPDQIIRRVENDHLITTLYNARHPGMEERLCGGGRQLSPANRSTETRSGWRYIDGPIACDAIPGAAQTFSLEQFRARDRIDLIEGWSVPEANGGNWNGIWSNGIRSRIELQADAGHKTLSLLGNYLEGNARTRVIINGKDLGWHPLDQAVSIPLPQGAAGTLLIELEHESPHPPNASDPRLLAIFLREVTLK